MFSQGKKRESRVKCKDKSKGSACAQSYMASRSGLDLHETSQNKKGTSQRKLKKSTSGNGSWSAGGGSTPNIRREGVGCGAISLHEGGSGPATPRQPQSPRGSVFSLLSKKPGLEEASHGAIRSEESRGSILNSLAI